MVVNLTEAAAKSLDSQMQADDILWIHYDSEGCGCAVSGVAALTVLAREHLPQEPCTEASVPQATIEQPIVVLDRHTVFFDETMTLDYREDTDGFILKSNGQIYGNDLTLRLSSTSRIR